MLVIKDPEDGSYSMEFTNLEAWILHSTLLHSLRTSILGDQTRQILIEMSEGIDDER
jgi:hypothetical protein